MTNTYRVLVIEVVTRSISDPDYVTRKQINFLSRADRAWLAKHCWWAMHEGYSVTTAPVDGEVQ